MEKSKFQTTYSFSLWKKKLEKALGFSNFWGFSSPNLFMLVVSQNTVLRGWYSFPVDKSQFFQAKSDQM